MEGQRIWTKNFIIVCLSSFFMFLTFYVLATAFPLYVRDSLHGNQQQMGLAITIYVVGGVLLRPFSGQWVDRYGKKKMAILGMVVFLLACIGYFGAKGIFLFLVIRLVHGMSYAVASTATSTIASSLIPNSRQGEGMGYFSMFMSISMVVGPALGLFLWKDQNIDALLLTVCGIAALSLIFALAIKDKKQPRRPVTDTLPSPTEEAPRKKGMRWSDIIEPKALPISLVGFALAFSYSPIAGFIASFTAEIHQTQVTSLFFVVFAIMIVAFRPLVGKVFDRYKEHYLYYPGTLLFAIGMLVLSQAHSGTMVLAASVLMGIGYGALFPCFQALAMKLSPVERRGAATGTFFLLFDMGYGLGSYCMGLVASYTNYRMMFFVAALITLLSISVYYVLHHRRQLPVRNIVNVSSSDSV